MVGKTHECQWKPSLIRWIVCPPDAWGFPFPAHINWAKSMLYAVVNVTNSRRWPSGRRKDGWEKRWKFWEQRLAGDGDGQFGGCSMRIEIVIGFIRWACCAHTHLRREWLLWIHHSLQINYAHRDTITRAPLIYNNNNYSNKSINSSNYPKRA